MDYDDKQRRDIVTDLSNLGKSNHHLLLEIWDLKPQTLIQDVGSTTSLRGYPGTALQATILTYTQVGSQVVAAYEEKNSSKLTTECEIQELPPLGPPIPLPHFLHFFFN